MMNDELKKAMPDQQFSAPSPKVSFLASFIDPAPAPFDFGPMTFSLHHLSFFRGGAFGVATAFLCRFGP